MTRPPATTAGFRITVRGRRIYLVLLQVTFACSCRSGCLRLDSQLRRGEQRQWTSLTG
jgi:hypothetical protein